MPPKAIDKGRSPKKERLTLAQLTAYDDILTDALVDQVYYWTTIRKNKHAYHSSRGIREEDVTAIIRKSVIYEEDAAQAEAQLLQLPGLKKFSDALKSPKQKEDFRKHLRKYVNIYLPDCAFEVSSTNRYTVSTHEASVMARKHIKKGEVIKYLCGVQIMMTEEEEDLIKESRRDFSIVCSGRNRHARPSLFLGPGRFANHDCDANARLMTSGKDGMEIIALRPIHIGDEITVSYGDHFFDEDNSSCLCKTCEDLCRNGWTVDPSSDTNPTPSIEELPAGRSLRNKRHISRDSSRDPSMTPDVVIRPQISKRTPKSISRFLKLESPLGRSPSADRSPSPLKRKRDLDPPTPGTPSRKKSKLGITVKLEEPKLGMDAVPDLSPDSTRPSRQASPFSGEDASSTDATSVDEETCPVEDDTAREVAIDLGTFSDDTIIVEIPDSPSHLSASKLQTIRDAKAPLEQAESGAPLLISDTTSIEHPAIQDDLESILSDLTDLPSDYEFEEGVMTVEARTKETKKNTQRRKRAAIAPKIDLDHAPEIRVPGDYVLNVSLLAVNESAWINCKICEDPFVQGDAYFTRSSCPRCERHSKLYGYMWPKTEKEGWDDDEERVKDHRTIHRFIAPSEEKISRKKDRTSTGSRALTEAVEVTETADSTEEQGNGGRRSSRRSMRISNVI